MSIVAKLGIAQYRSVLMHELLRYTLFTDKVASDHHCITTQSLLVYLARSKYTATS